MGVFWGGGGACLHLHQCLAQNKLQKGFFNVALNPKTFS